MKKVWYGILLVLGLILVGCNQKDTTETKKIDLLKAQEKVEIPSIVDEDISLLTEITFEGEVIFVTYKSSDESIITNSGKVTRPTYEEGMFLSL